MIDVFRGTRSDIVKVEREDPTYGEGFWGQGVVGMTTTKPNVLGTWNGDPTTPGLYVQCEDAWIGPYTSASQAADRCRAANEGPCRHLHTVVLVGLHGPTTCGKLGP